MTAVIMDETHFQSCVIEYDTETEAIVNTEWGKKCKKLNKAI